jgi:hypothetical protein
MGSTLGESHGRGMWSDRNETHAWDDYQQPVGDLCSLLLCRSRHLDQPLADARCRGLQSRERFVLIGDH